MSPAADNIDERIEDLADWRGEMLARVRKLILEVHPDIEEEWKWRGVPVWSLEGILCTGESYKEVVKLTFAKGARMKDPKKLFNASLTGNARRAIDLFEGDKLNATHFKQLIQAAIDVNMADKAHRAKLKALKRH
jgi:hypothetical protein